MPEYLWGHDCKYVFINQTNGDNWSSQKQTPPFQYNFILEELYDTTVGITENNPEGSGENLSVEVFPNPASERINFTYLLPAGNTSGKLSIFNSSGKLIRIFNLMAMQGQVVYNTSTLPNGVYFYTVMSEGKKETGKFVVVE